MTSSVRTFASSVGLPKGVSERGLRAVDLTRPVQAAEPVQQRDSLLDDPAGAAEAGAVLWATGGRTFGSIPLARNDFRCLSKP